MIVRFGWLIGLAASLSAAIGPQGVTAQIASQGDSTVTQAFQSPDNWMFPISRFDTIGVREFTAPRTFSFDQFIEYLPTYLIGRLGPLGAQASYSRFGLGRGRGMVYLGSIPLNDPQDGAVPLEIVPSSSVGSIVFGPSPTRHLPGQAGIEGVMRIIEPRGLPREPMAYIEVANGDHDLKQRRARYSSPRKPAGLDISIDELRNAGYAFVPGGPNGTDYGSSTVRVSDMELRGALPTGESYRFALKRFQTTFQGDTLDAFSESRRNGFLTLLQTSVKAFDVDVFGRSYVVDTPDSVTQNLTTSLAVSVPVARDNGPAIVVGAGFQSTDSRQDIAGGSSAETIEEASASVAVNSALGDGTRIEITADVAHQFGYAWGWGARLAATRELGTGQRLTLEGVRGFRLPNLGELFLPLHFIGASATSEGVGNTDLKSESALEAGLRLQNQVGPISNELRATTIRVQDPILNTEVQTMPVPRIQPVNGEAQGLQIIDDRFRIASRRWGFELVIVGGAMVAIGNRDDYFEGVPEVRGVAAASIGRSLFKDSSHILLGAEYEYSGSRIAGGGPELSPYGVVNLKLEGRLVDAHLYLLWLNVSDEQYMTVWPYLMTPRTFAYGIAWTFYN